MKKIISSLLSFMLLSAAFPDTVNAQVAGCSNSIDITVNGNFSAGNAGFACGLPFSGACGSNSYLVANNFQVKCAAWPNTFDHTFGNATGSFLMIDGNTAVGFNVWSQNVSVCAGTAYTFSFWANNIYNNAFTVNMNVNGVTVGAVGAIPMNAWTQFSTTWVSTVTGVIPIQLFCTTGGAQRDFGVDDIFFGYCGTTTVTPSTSICSGSCTTLTASASGATSYNWSTGATTSSIVVCPGSTTSYSVTAVGCLTYTPATTTVTVNPTPTVTATASPSTLTPPFATTSFISSSASGGSGFTYSWTPSSTLNSGTVSNPVATPSTTTVYTEAVTNSYGCTGYTNVTVNVAPASLCTLTYDYDIPTGQNSATYFSGIPTLSGKNIRITGTFTVNSSLMFSGCNVEMEPGSSIVVTGSGTIIYVTGQSHFYSCEGMWNGIDLQNGTSAQIMNSSIIEDAIKGVKINQGAFADIEFCTFNKNYTAVELTSNTSATSPVYMIGCVVTTRDLHFSDIVTANPSAATIWSNIVAGTAPAVVNMKTPFYSYKSIYGVFATDVNALQIGSNLSAIYLNGFDNLMSSGIYLTRSNTVIYNNEFRNITNAPNCLTCTPLIGVGVYANGSTSVNYSLQVGGSGVNQPNTFTDIYSSIEAANYQMNYVLNNTITNSITSVPIYGGTGKSGIKITPMSNNTISVQNNTLTNCATGVWINRNSSTANQTVNMWLDYNTISANASGYCTNAIYVQDIVAMPSLLPTVSEIGYNTIIQSANCINLLNSKTKTDVMLNSCMTRYAASGNINGIKMVSCQNQSVYLNHTKYDVATAGLSGGNIQAYGIFLQNTTNGSERCNTIEDAARSFVVDGACFNPNSISQNTFRRAQDGFVLLSSGTTIGNQGSSTFASNNYWDLSAGMYFTGSHIVNNSGTTLLMYYNNTVTPAQTTVPTIIVGPFTGTIITGYTPTPCAAVPARLAGPEEQGSGSFEISTTLFIYPNPSTGTFFLETHSAEAKDIFVYDVMGKEVISMKQVYDSNVSIDISDQPAGMYTVRVVNKNSTESKHIIKQ